jgi:hypothetical protein
MKTHRRSIHSFLQCGTIADTTLLGPEVTSDVVGGLVAPLQPTEPVDKRSAVEGLLDEATKEVSTVVAASAVDINPVKAADLIITDDSGADLLVTKTPLAETVVSVKNVPTGVCLPDEDIKVASTVVATPAIDIDAVKSAGLITDDPGADLLVTKIPLAETVVLVKSVSTVAAKASDAHQSGTCPFIHIVRS